jgi:methionyl-tRNA formyltransferase
MRVVFMGTPDFAVPSLEALDEAFEVVAAVTRPDAVRARGKKLEPSSVKTAALSRGIEVVETKKITPEILELIGEMKPDAIAVAAFGCILPDELIALAPLGCVNVHASILPRWRGAAPVPRAVLAGDREVGVSIMKVVHELDAGDYSLVGRVAVGDSNSTELLGELARIGARLLVEALERMEAGTLEWHEQDESLVTFAPKITKQEMKLVAGESAAANKRRVQASTDAAPARFALAGKGVRVLEARVVSDLAAAEGAFVVEHGRCALGCADGVLELLRVKPDGKKDMDAKSWLAGMREPAGTWE